MYINIKRGGDRREHLHRCYSNEKAQLVFAEMNSQSDTSVDTPLVHSVANNPAFFPPWACTSMDVLFSNKCGFFKRGFPWNRMENFLDFYDIFVRKRPRSTIQDTTWRGSWVKVYCVSWRSGSPDGLINFSFAFQTRKHELYHCSVHFTGKKTWKVAEGTRMDYDVTDVLAHATVCAVKDDE